MTFRCPDTSYTNIYVYNIPKLNIVLECIIKTEVMTVCVHDLVCLLCILLLSI